MKEYLINSKKYRLRTFEKIETPYHGYLIGYLAGDGSFSAATHKRVARLSVGSSEEDIINGFRDFFCPDTVVGSKWPINNTPGRNIKANKLSYILTFSSKFHETFNKFGILSLKKDRSLVNISKKDMKRYLHGLFDADGHISWGYRKDRNRLWGKVGITHQSLSLLKKVQKYLEEELDISSSVAPRNDEDCLDLQFSKRESIEKFVLWLYDEEVTFPYNKTKRDHAFAYVKAFNS